jgi:predicted short-subunit dehydrogenase-like oxidoreductase (DUF2520 family)
MAIRTAVVIGSGNVATHLGRALKLAGVTVRSVYGRNITTVKQLASELDTIAVTDLKDLTTGADLYLIAVKDSAIAEVSAAINVKHGMVVHTSGITPMSILQHHTNTGVLYPLQTLTKHSPADLSQLPLLVEANTASGFEDLSKLASAVSANVYAITSEQRQFVHLAAVFANNFTNHLYAIAGQLAHTHHIPFDLFKPIIAETAAKIKQYDPRSVQTGPAIRNDAATIEKHLALLQQTPELRQIYELMSRSIRAFSDEAQGTTQ